MPAGADLLVALVAAGAVAALFAAATALRRRGSACPEVVRKTSHLTSTVIALVAPACATTPGPLLAVLALTTVFLLVAARRRLYLATYDVARATYGAPYFALAALVLLAVFWTPCRTAYLAGVLTLGFGDGLAGLVGTLAGRHGFTVGRNTRSIEGSLVMLAASWLALTTLFLAATPLDACAAVAAAATVALMATIVEAAAPGGSDNLWVPLVGASATFYLLHAAPGERRILGASALASATMLAAGLWSCARAPGLARLGARRERKGRARRGRDHPPPPVTPGGPERHPPGRR